MVLCEELALEKRLWACRTTDYAMTRSQQAIYARTITLGIRLSAVIIS
jgi:hypothetical protein